MERFRFDRLTCPWCGQALNAGAAGPGSPDESPPSTGDLAVCTGCAELSIVTVGSLGINSLRRATYNEYVAFSAAYATEWGTLRGIIGATPHPESPLNS